ncbi:MAG: hypothetical protein ACM3U2_04275, partial [Deltaproteobacteria bacterium]
VSRKLGERGITVDKLVLLEASANGRVPGNVRECVNIYKPQPWTEYFPFFRGCTVAADSPVTQLVNYNLREFNDGRYDWDNHFTVTFNPYVRDLMMDEVLSGIEEVPEQDEMLSALEEGDGLSVAEEIPASMN